MKKEDCVFCQIVEGSAPSHQIWEDEKHLAFLSIFPNTEGFSVIIPKDHHDSYFANVSEEVVTSLVKAAQQVAKKIDAAFPDVGRTGLVFEGFGVDHLHAKLIPLHGTSSDEWKQHRSSNKKYFAHYEGFISSHDFERADDTGLSLIAKRIRDAA